MTLIYLCVTIWWFHLVRKSKRIIQKEHKAEVNLEFEDVSGPDNNPQLHGINESVEIETLDGNEHEESDEKWKQAMKDSSMLN